MDASLHVPFKSGPESRHHLDSRGGRDAVYGLDHCRGQRRSYLEESLMLHTLQLPPSPQLSLDGRHASSFDLSHSSTTPLQSTFGSRSTSEDAVSWRMHMCLQPTPAPAQPSSPISLDGFGSQFDYLQLQQQQHAQSFQSESSSYPVAGTGVSPEISPLMASSGLSNEMDVTQSHLYGLPPPSHAINYHDPAIYDIQHGREIGYPQIPQPSPGEPPASAYRRGGPP